MYVKGMVFLERRALAVNSMSQKLISAAIADSMSDAKRECAYSGYDVMA